MTNYIVLSEKFKEKLNTSESQNALQTKNINSIDEFEKLMLRCLNSVDNKLKVSRIEYTDLKSDMYIGKIHDEDAGFLAYISIIPPKLETRSGFLSQQVFGFISNIVMSILNSPCHQIVDKPFYILNTDIEDISLSKAINIIGAEILNLTFIDLYGRTIEESLPMKKHKSEFKTLTEFSSLIDDNSYFELTNRTIRFKTDKLKSLSAALTNEPYYFAIKAYPALYLAYKERYDIDLSLFETWYESGSNSNKNIKAFYLYAKKLEENRSDSLQKVFYGAPGTGKSFMIDSFLQSHQALDSSVFRVTIHPEFSYSDFVGQLLPTIVNDGVNREITYDFSKGVFTQALEKAYSDINTIVYLVLEEISRGDIASVLGDIFQLLDRETYGPYKGYSRYFINNEVVAKDILAFEDNKIKLPPNFCILGTVNTSDQNVFVMDTAFKRRFDWEYVSTRGVKSLVTGEYLNNPNVSIVKIDGTLVEYEWVSFYTCLNSFISKKEYLELSEDKQIGPFFIEFNNEDTKNKIKNKLLQYLWNDIHKSSFKRSISLFSEEIACFSDLYFLFEDDKCVFSSMFLDYLDGKG